jgi:methionine synthase I (cobalamin-dependent)
MILMGTKPSDWGGWFSEVRVADGWKPQLQHDTADSNPAFFKSALQMYVQAGVDVLRVSSASGVALAREIAPDLTIWGTVATVGRVLALREVEPDEMRELYRCGCAELLSAEPDALILEGFDDLEEAVIALEGAKEAGSQLTGVVVALGSGSERVDTLLGQSCEEVVQQLEAAGAQLIGCGCRLGVDEMVLAVREMRALTTLPILAAPDVGQRELSGENIVFGEPPEDFAAKALSLKAAGANVIAGCCGADHTYLKAVVDALQSA